MAITERVKRWIRRIIIALVLFVAFSAITLMLVVRFSNKSRAAQSMLKIVAAALANYEADFHAYPPDTVDKDGSEILDKFLCRPLKAGEMHYGPYIHAAGAREITSPLGGRYFYKLIDGEKGRTPLIIDPGADKQLGGTIDPKKGFVPDGSGANLDNLYSTEPGENQKP
jgi:hypothetical protein